jgi:hypothetical protein
MSDKKTRVKGLDRVLAQALKHEAGLNKIEEKLTKWNVRNETNEHLPTSGVIEALKVEGFKPPRAKSAAKATEPEVKPGDAVVLTDDACEVVMERYGYDVRPTGLTVIKVERDGNAKNAPRIVMLSDANGQRIQVKLSQLALPAKSKAA